MRPIMWGRLSSLPLNHTDGMNEKAGKQETNDLPPAVMDFATLAVTGRAADRSLLGARLRRVVGLPARELVLAFDLSASDKGPAFDAWLFSADPLLFRVHPWLGDLPGKSEPSHLAEVASHHLSGARVESVEVVPFERILVISFVRREYSGERIGCRFIAELMGKHSNLILIDRDSVILASWKPVHSYQSRAREVRAGKEYAPPPSQSRITPRRFTDREWRSFLKAADEFDPICDHLARTFSGMSAGWAKSVCERAGIPATKPVAEMTNEEGEVLLAAFCDTLDLVQKGIPLTGEEPHAFVRRVAASFTARADHAAVDRARADIRRVLGKRRKRLRALEKALGEDLEGAERAGDYRKRADLLTANIHAVSPGMDAIEVDDWETGERVRLPLDPGVPPQQQAERWYERYHKLKRRKTVAEERRRAVQAEEQELDELETALSQVSDMEGADRVREQGVLRGFLEPAYPTRMKRGGTRPEKGERRRRSVAERETSAHRYRSNDGFLILAGKGDRSNDALRRMSSPDDIWLHVRDIPGSHVYIVTRGRKVPDTTLREAAMVAVWHSKARDGSSVPVDYTRAKYVTPIPGERLGKVRFKKERTLRVTPDPRRLEMMRLVAGDDSPDGA